MKFLTHPISKVLAIARSPDITEHTSVCITAPENRGAWVVNGALDVKDLDFMGMAVTAGMKSEISAWGGASVHHSKVIVVWFGKIWLDIGGGKHGKSAVTNLFKLVTLGPSKNIFLVFSDGSRADEHSYWYWSEREMPSALVLDGKIKKDGVNVSYSHDAIASLERTQLTHRELTDTQGQSQSDKRNPSHAYCRRAANAHRSCRQATT